MNLQAAVQPKLSSNGFGRRRVERDVGSRSENKLQPGKSNSGRITNIGAVMGGESWVAESPCHDRLAFLTTCLIGLPVEVQVKNGSVYSGIFHATNANKDFGVILKMARLVKDGTLRGQKAQSEFVSKPPSKTLIIAAKELVQVIAKDVPVTRDDSLNELRRVKQEDLMTDSFISQSRHIELERELEPWVPDKDDPDCPELDNIFDGPWNRGWNQFETNEMLFGVKSTFDADLYTTKLDRGPQMRDREKEATRIAREIEGEETEDLHLAEERGIQLHEDLDVDEETKYSSVFRGRGLDDSGYEEEENILLNARNIDTFGDISASVSKRPFDLTCGNSYDGTQLPSSSSVMDEALSLQSNANVHTNCSGSHDHAQQLASELPAKLPVSDYETRIQENMLGKHEGREDAKVFVEKQMPSGDLSSSNIGDSQSSMNLKIGSSEKGQSANATTYDKSRVPYKHNEKQTSSGERLKDPLPGKVAGEAHYISSYGMADSSTSSSSDCARVASASTGHGLSPSSSMGSLSSERSMLNPNAKEFRLNPNAKSFKPSQSQSPVRAQSPVADASFYYPSASAVPHMHVGFGMGPSFSGHQPVLFNPSVAPMQPPQAYFHPNGPQYGQHMLVGQPRPVMYMPNYQPEMPYKGRDY